MLKRWNFLLCMARFFFKFALYRMAINNHALVDSWEVSIFPPFSKATFTCQVYTFKIKFGASDNKEISKTIVIRAGHAQLLISGV